MSSPFTPGQRYLSQSEPELGLGTVESVEGRTVVVGFAASQETRTYAVASAPLSRLRFAVGDRLSFKQYGEIVVQAVESRDGVLWYQGEDTPWLCESQISSRMSGKGALSRVKLGQFESRSDFLLRFTAYGHLSRQSKAAHRGFAGVRVSLLEHQLAVAARVSRQVFPRVLLADEVGLGKTIEACLILHRMLLIGTLRRALIVVPESLVHQWFVELYRKCNLKPMVFDSAHTDRREAKMQHLEQASVVIVSLELLSQMGKTGEQLHAQSWDMLIVDEAHHLYDGADETGTHGYKLIEQFARKVPSVLLLTATPQQTGDKGHYTRLRLLDPQQYARYDVYKKIDEQLERLSKVLQRYEAGNVRDTDRIFIETLLADAPEGCTLGEQAKPPPQTLHYLLDLFGIGRSFFRSVRDSVGIFCKRTLTKVAIDSVHDQFDTEWQSDVGLAPEATSLHFARDARLDWICRWCREHPEKKALLICRSAEKVTALHERLRKNKNMHVAQFHQQMSLMQRDRQAAWFARSDGAQLLLASEIGSEGRNFQFCQTVIFFDLPPHPELIEQRIGRLDRIGQSGTIQIVVFYKKGHPINHYLQWLENGCDIFSKPRPSVDELFTKASALARQLLCRQEQTWSKKQLQPKEWFFHAMSHESIAQELIHTTAGEAQQLYRLTSEGKNKLFEYFGCVYEEGARLKEAIEDPLQHQQLLSWCETLCTYFGVQIDPGPEQTVVLSKTEHFKEGFALEQDACTATFDRTQALAREDITFLTWDHPMIADATELLLSGESGSCCSGCIDEAFCSDTVLEFLFVATSAAASQYHAARFFPVTPMRLVLDSKGRNRTPQMSVDALNKALVVDAQPSHRDLARAKKQLPALYAQAKKIADKGLEIVSSRAQNAMLQWYEAQRARLQHLRKVSPQSVDRELAELQKAKEALSSAYAQPVVQLDALCILVPREQ